MRGRLGRLGPAVVIVAVLALPTLDAMGALEPLNDLLALGHGIGQQPAKAPVAQRAEPPFVATPRAVCGPGSKPEPGIQGRVPAGAASDGLRCNATLVAHQGTSGGFKVWRYVDTHGHECAFYDTALLFPVNALKLDTTSQGVAVLDMSDPAHPEQTATLTELPMLSPHESLNLNVRRGLLAAVLGNPSTYPGLVSIYDVHADCRHPVLQSTRPVARLGHESGFSPDGRTFWATGTARESITAVDVTNPKDPHAVWQGNIVSHGMSLSRDGNRAYVADATGGDMLILDVSQIQAREPDPQAREVSRLTWHAASIPQNAIPFTSGGRPYVLEFDEYTQGTTGVGDRDMVGAARIIDISDERAPRVISNIRLQVNQPADHAAASGDPGALSPVQGYAAHYCSLSSDVDPTVVACSFITSGLRVFDITDVTHPKEIAYYVAPTQPRAENGFMESAFAMSKPAIVPARREIWYSDGPTGFYVVRISDQVWPAASTSAPCLSGRARVSRRGIGRVRLGRRRSALPAPRRATAHSWRWCVNGGGRVAAVFGRSGRVVLVARARHGTVRYVASRRTRAHPKLVRRYLRYAGVRRR